jgi:hypothetical protein
MCFESGSVPEYHPRTSVHRVSFHAVTTGGSQPWWFLDPDRDRRRDTLMACILVIPFAVVPALLGWPYWSQWLAPVAYLVALYLAIKVRLSASRRWLERRPEVSAAD